MSCKCATYEPDDGRWQCSVSGCGCMYLIPNSKRCAIDYGEGPDSDKDKSELIEKLRKEHEELRKLDDITDEPDELEN